MMPPGAYQPAFLRTADSCARQGRGRRRELAQRAAESVHHPFVATIRPGADRWRPVQTGARGGWGARPRQVSEKKILPDSSHGLHKKNGRYQGYGMQDVAVIEDAPAAEVSLDPIR